MARILMVVTSASRMGDAPEPTGIWIEEFAAPYYVFLDAGCKITVASPLGAAAPIDPKSALEENQTASTHRFDKDAPAQSMLKNTAKLSTLNAQDYDAIYFPGGHGTMADLPNDASVKATVEAFHTAHKPVASVCHGPACLVNAVDAAGAPIIRGKRFTCFSDEEERIVGLEKIVPFLLESKLSELGGIAKVAAPFTPHVIVDGCMMTGQNPASSAPLAEAVLHALSHKHSIASQVA